MNISRYLALTIFVSAGVMTAAAQSSAVPETTQPQTQPRVEGFQPVAPQSGLRGRALSANPLVTLGKTPPVLMLSENNSVCYTMRSYTFPRDNSADATRPTGYSTCQPSGQVHVRDAVMRVTPAAR